MKDTSLAILIIPALMALVLFVLGYNFRKGKLLRFIAGNTVVYDEDLKSPEQIRIGKQAGLMMIDMGFCAIFTMFAIIGDYLSIELMLDIAGFLVLASCVAFFVYLVFSMIKNKKLSR